MTLHIQDPDDPESSYLLDTLRNACEGAKTAGGAFAFLSAGGIKLFFQDEVFQGFANAGGKFSLVAGVDAVTDTKAIAALDQARSAYPGLTAKVHLPTNSRSIYHPKFAWFRKSSGGILVAGSGNMTAGGLRWNVEAFTVQTLSAAEINAVEGKWTGYLAKKQAALYETDHPEVIKRLERNSQLQAILKQGQLAVSPEVLVPAQDGHAETPVDVDSVPMVTPDVRVLVAEIPRSGDRWKQANFDLDSFINFFGASKTQHREVLFFNVRPNGTLAPQEVRPAVAVSSQNYRFELNAASGLPYPKEGRPIAVFARIAVRTFIYVLVMPGDGGHTRMLHLLNQTEPKPRGMRRLEFSAAQVRAAWPASPLWKSLSL